jgi:hypothetical protein
MLIPVAKVKMINVRLSEKAHNDFKIAAELRGASMSTLLHQFIVGVTREEKERDPKAFEQTANVLNAAAKQPKEPRVILSTEITEKLTDIKTPKIKRKGNHNSR